MNYENNKLKNITDEIENLDIKYHIEILRIFKNNNINITENNNGCFINMNDVNDKIIKEIKDFILFNKNNETELKKQEEIKKSLIENVLKS